MRNISQQVFAPGGSKVRALIFSHLLPPARRGETFEAGWYGRQVCLHVQYNAAAGALMLARCYRYAPTGAAGGGVGGSWVGAAGQHTRPSVSFFFFFCRRDLAKCVRLYHIKRFPCYSSHLFFILAALKCGGRVWKEQQIRSAHCWVGEMKPVSTRLV